MVCGINRRQLAECCRRRLHKYGGDNYISPLYSILLPVHPPNKESKNHGHVSHPWMSYQKQIYVRKLDVLTTTTTAL